MSLTESQIAKFKRVTSNEGIDVLTNNEHKVFDSGHLYSFFQCRDNQLLKFLKEKGYVIANYDLRSDSESGSYSDWALLNSNNTPALSGVCDYSGVAFEKIHSYAVEHLEYKVIP